MMFLGSTSTIISIIFGLGLQWVLLVAGHDLYLKISKDIDDASPVSTSIYSSHDRISSNDESFCYNYATWGLKNIAAEAAIKYADPNVHDHHFAQFLKKQQLLLHNSGRRGPPSILISSLLVH